VRLLEAQDHVASAWRRHYDRLHLHTDRRHSGLPFLPMPREYPRYPSRLQVVEYLESYTRHFGLDVRTGTRATTIRRKGNTWVVETDLGVLETGAVVVATGNTRRPIIPTWPGLDAFRGTCLHSSQYRSGASFAGARALVVGFGNSGGEVALDLLEHGAAVCISVRGPVNVLPKELLGIPILSLAIPLARLPPAIADRLTSPIQRVLYSDLERHGLARAVRGPMGQIAGRNRIPLLDVGTIARIRSGELEVRPGIREFSSTEVCFTDGREEPFDVVVLATGYEPGLGELLREVPGAATAGGLPVRSGVRGVVDGLFFCGFYVSPTGMLREIGLEARRIAREIQRNAAGRAS
jgi:cation diffusion facilitator CzcD-associated flavoprotein CzcO